MIFTENLAKTFRRTKALDGINLSITRGERVALIGSNGAGKTTLIRCLLGEYVCTGVVRVHQLDPRQHRAEVLGKIGFVPQLPPPLRMPVGQLIEFSASLCGVPPKRMTDIAGELGLDTASVRSLQFLRLSGGMKQKLLIAIALGRDTEVLLMDEPAANLDPDARRIFFELLAHRQANVAMLISCHRLSEMSAIVNRVVEMDMGRVTKDYPCAEGALASHE
ncbi:MAG: ATP-binding cassette domain-containing protein [Azoarcus sp.]|jgi:ABC-2 type transport system ATP-binding protein|nr:ATP-binding cassette domain-containing protein [Azoarcus sp.]